MAEETSGAVQCPFCEAGISPTARKCRFCGEWVARPCDRCGTPIRDEWAARGRCAECASHALTERPAAALTGRRSRVAAALFALLLGGFGAHKFYLGRIGMGVLYFVFSWTLIPSLVALFEGISYLVATDEEFERRHG